MIAQIIDLSSYNVFNLYKTKYGLSEHLYCFGLLALEIRQIDSRDIDLNLFAADEHAFILSDEVLLSILILGTTRDFYFTAEKFNDDIKTLLHCTIENYLYYDGIKYTLAKKEFLTEEVKIMGIINITPDSFSDGGKYFSHESAFSAAEEMLNEGADIIDIGGESSRPGSESISAKEEIDRIIPVIKRIREKYPGAIISADTTKSEVALNALRAGANIINDISGVTFDIKIFEVVKEFDAALIIMHIKGIPKNMQVNPVYNNLVNEIYDFLWHQCLTAKDYGINQIIIDPGIGFGKKIEHNLELIKRLSDFKSIGHPILFGSSRKSYLGKITDLDVTERDVVSVISDAFAVNSGARIIRTHNVKYGVQLKKFYKAMIN